jgi:hypothetical protein
MAEIPQQNLLPNPLLQKMLWAFTITHAQKDVLVVQARLKNAQIAEKI